MSIASLSTFGLTKGLRNASGSLLGLSWAIPGDPRSALGVLLGSSWSLRGALGALLGLMFYFIRIFKNVEKNTRFVILGDLGLLWGVPQTI